MGRGKCHIELARVGFLTGPRPDEATTKAGPEAQQRGNVMRAPADPAHLQGKHPAVLNAINFKSDGAGIVTISATLDAEGLELLEKKIAALKLLIN